MGRSSAGAEHLLEASCLLGKILVRACPHGILVVPLGVPAVLALQRFHEAVGDNQVMTLCEVLRPDLSTEASGGSSNTLVAGRKVASAHIAAPLELRRWDFTFPSKESEVSPGDEHLATSLPNQGKRLPGGVRAMSLKLRLKLVLCSTELESSHLCR